ncbi:hypothetical protein [Shigella sonnei]|uniref:hypothetical protein n=1 Tax=Shigella sonnei TaxID=624 RepID=UPI0006636C0C|nr:hypothetical protein [Shigella sonnei]CSG22599.1 Uncharacterised protein [Shigella sonnei]
MRNQHRFYLLNHYTESLSVMSLTKLSLNTRMIGFMSDQMLETAPRLTRAVSDETSVYAGAGTQGNRLNGVLFIQVYLLDQQFGISKQMFERCQMS